MVYLLLNIHDQNSFYVYFLLRKDYLILFYVILQPMGCNAVNFSIYICNSKNKGGVLCG